MTVRQMTYQPLGGSWEPVETMSFERLRGFNEGRTQRGDFHVIAVVTGGTGTVAVDFRVYPLTRCSVVWITPGAVHEWRDIAAVDGRVVLFTPTAPVTEATREMTASRDIEARWAADRDEWPLIVASIDHLALEADGSSRGAASEIPAILVSALIARLRPPHSSLPPRNPLYRLFQTSVEEHFRRRHDVAFYAETLGYSPRTLTRACQEETGRTAKRLISERLLLESQRLLAHDQLTVTQCASALGFVDPSAFSDFFARGTGCRPGAWQQRWKALS